MVARRSIPFFLVVLLIETAMMHVYASNREAVVHNKHLHM